MPNQEATDLAMRCIRRARDKGASPKVAARVAATILTKAAMDRGSRDNITVMVIDLSRRGGRCCSRGGGGGSTCSAGGMSSCDGGAGPRQSHEGGRLAAAAAAAEAAGGMASARRPAPQRIVAADSKPSPKDQQQQQQQQQLLTPELSIVPAPPTAVPARGSSGGGGGSVPFLRAQNSASPFAAECGSGGLGLCASDGTPSSNGSGGIAGGGSGSSCFSSSTEGAAHTPGQQLEQPQRHSPLACNQPLAADGGGPFAAVAGAADSSRGGPFAAANAPSHGVGASPPPPPPAPAGDSASAGKAPPCAVQRQASTSPFSALNLPPFEDGDGQSGRGDVGSSSGRA